MTSAPERIWVDAAGGHWSPVAGGTQEIEYIRADRTVPLPLTLTQDVIAWEKLPDWVETVMRDENGKVFASYTNYPLNGSGIRIDDFPGIVQIGTCDWKDSKQRRPQK